MTGGNVLVVMKHIKVPSKVSSALTSVITRVVSHSQFSVHWSGNQFMDTETWSLWKSLHYFVVC